MADATIRTPDLDRLEALARAATCCHDHDYREPEECEDCPGPRSEDCGCDACLYGRDALSQAVLALIAEVRRLRENTPQAICTRLCHDWHTSGFCLRCGHVGP